MNDRDLLTLKAFIAAYEANNQPFIPELADIQADLDNRVQELGAIAQNHARLRDDYTKARKLLTSAASTRKAGLYATPKPQEEDDSKDVENIVRIVDEQTKEKLKSRLSSQPQ